jgi:hypothetical protein
VAENQVLLANGAPAETYRDEGNRWMFRNGRPGSAQGEATVWDRPGVAPYAPVLTGGPLVDAVWAELLARAGPRIPIPTTDDPDLHLLVDGVRLDGQMMGDGRWVFRLSHAPREVVIASRAGRQDELGRQRDPRLLGVALSQIVLWDSPNPEIIEADHPELRDGFHAYEADGGIIWTNGHAVLPELCRPRRAGHLHLYVRHTAHYPYPEEARAAA